MGLTIALDHCVLDHHVEVLIVGQQAALDLGFVAQTNV
jgi:hypothetical protein